LFEGHCDATVVEQCLDEPGLGWRNERGERTARGVYLPPGQPVPTRHEVAVVSRGEAETRPLLDEADDFRWNHNDNCGLTISVFPLTLLSPTLASSGSWGRPAVACPSRRGESVQAPHRGNRRNHVSAGRGLDDADRGESHRRRRRVDLV